MTKKYRKKHYNYKCNYCEKTLFLTQSKIDSLKTHHCNRHCYLKSKRKEQLLQYQKLKRTIKISTKFQNWFAGFVDGEGCCAIKLNDKNYKYGFVSFKISQKEKHILNYIKSILNFGHVYQTLKSIYTFDCNGYAKCKIIYDFLKGKVKTINKQNQLKLWKKYFNFIERRG
jgi:hypothetical protein